MKLDPIAEVRSHIQLGGVDRTLIFNVNTMVAFEQATGKFFLHVVGDLLNAVFPNGVGEGKASIKNPYAIISKIPMADLRALLWATIHEYDANDNPTWPLTLNQVGRLLSLSDIIPIFNTFLKGQTANNPTKAEMGESQAEEKKPIPIDTPPITQETGGERGIELPADAFA